MSDLENLQLLFSQKIAKVDDLQVLEALRVEFLGKEGHFNHQMKQMSSLALEEKKAFGAKVNVLKTIVTDEIAKLKNQLDEKALNERLLKEVIDVTLAPREYEVGKLHPISKVIEEIREIFGQLGFEFAEGPEIETEWYNFTALNIPESHPARQMHDTFYLEKDGLLLRTHTSNVQIRMLENGKPPFKLVSVGKVYRSDFDATHSPMFHQIECVYIDKDIHMGHLKGCMESFLKAFFNLEEVPMRLRPNHFPFTEPSAEIDIKCDRSNKKEIKIGKGNDWMEILGCGMIHPNVLKNAGIDPDEYQGFAFGVGIERLAMLKYNVPDLRSFFESDIRWLKHYGF